MKTILVVDDEQDILELIDYTLTKEGYDVICCIDTKNVRALLDEEDISLILMDRNLPHIEGSVFVKRLREDGYINPVIYISAKDTDTNILQGFDSGGDDYITKPFNLNLLKARVKALLKRTLKDMDNIKHRDIVYISQSKKFFIDGEHILLTKLEHNLFLEFIRNRGILLSRDTLLENVWVDDTDTKIKTVNVAIKRLKEKIDPKGVKNYIRAVPTEGYILD